MHPKQPKEESKVSSSTKGKGAECLICLATFGFESRIPCVTGTPALGFVSRASLVGASSHLGRRIKAASPKLRVLGFGSRFTLGDGLSCKPLVERLKDIDIRRAHEQKEGKNDKTGVLHGNQRPPG